MTAIRKRELVERINKRGAGLCRCGSTAITGKSRCSTCIEARNKSARKLKTERRAGGKCVTCGESSAPRKQCSTCLAKISAYNGKLRLTVVTAYGGKCACCGEQEARFLTIDHRNNDGKAERKIIANSARLYRSLIKRGFPKDAYQLLCFNCNIGRFWNGGVCPHQKRTNKFRSP